MKKTILSFLFLSILILLSSEEKKTVNLKESYFFKDSRMNIFISSNILSPFSVANLEGGDAFWYKVALSVLSNYEYGIQSSIGFYFDSFHSIELRLAFGSANQIMFISNIHIGYNFFPFDLIFNKTKLKRQIEKCRNKSKFYNKFKNSLSIFDPTEKGFYFGGYIKYFDIYNILTEIHFFNIMPYVAIGYVFEIGKIFFDIRISQTLCSLSWSNLSHTLPGFSHYFSPAPALTPILPGISLIFGYLISVDN